MNNIVASVAAQTAAKTLWDLEKRERQIRAAESRALEDFRVKVKYATYLLLGGVEYWWRSTRFLMGPAHEEVNWESFKRKFLDKYFLMSTRTKLGDDFLKLRQGSMTMGEYAAKFESLSREVEDMKNKRANRGGNFNSGGPIRVNQQDNKGKQVAKSYDRRQNYNKEQNHPGNQDFGRQVGQKPGHFAKNCKALKVEPIVNVTRTTFPTARGRVYCMGAEAGNPSSNLIQRDYEITGNSLTALSDSGATHSFIAMNCVNRWKLFVWLFLRMLRL
uniref:Uncharacterized protein LOC101488869 n=1 Tax=Cicer arietinum TaxID=3827 RepID=A0A1S2Y1P2_CICAR|nr:uncharacterized protein LOC101488869 [Cicer arietinum]